MNEARTQYTWLMIVWLWRAEIWPVKGSCYIKPVATLIHNGPFVVAPLKGRAPGEHCGPYRIHSSSLTHTHTQATRELHHLRTSTHVQSLLATPEPQTTGRRRWHSQLPKYNIISTTDLTNLTSFRHTNCKLWDFILWDFWNDPIMYWEDNW